MQRKPLGAIIVSLSNTLLKNSEDYMKRLLTSAVLVLLALVSLAPAQQTTRRLTINDLLKVRRVSDPQVSPDGRMIAFGISDPDTAANKSNKQLYIIPIAGGEPQLLPT